jgi:WD40 repeat protein
MSIVFSDDYTMLASFSTLGHVRVWDTETWQELRRIRDTEEDDIDEFFVGVFTPDGEHVAAAGKRKDRHRWSEDDYDNHILPCTVKIFNVLEGRVVTRLDGHEEEVLCIKKVQFKGDNYYITGSQDGYFIRWKMQDDWTTLDSSLRLTDGITCMCFSLSFLPNTGNKYFIASCDDKLRLFDFDVGRMVQTIDTPFSQYCDCVQVIECVTLPYDDTDKKPYVYIVCRGVETMDAQGLRRTCV